MKYFIDTEFHEGFHKPTFGRKRHFIDLISIGIVAEDGREYYAISKDFDIKAAWNSYQLEMVSGDMRNIFPEGKKVYWLRENVLRPIFYELLNKDLNFHDIDRWFTLNNFRNLIHEYGKSNGQIAEEIEQFCKPNKTKAISYGVDAVIGNIDPNIEFYGYYCDYDWVVFCALFGKMIDLPKGFPMYCKDLKQMLDEKIIHPSFESKNTVVINAPIDERLKYIKLSPNYPKQTDEHNALADAKWNRKLYDFINII